MATGNHFLDALEPHLRRLQLFRDNVMAHEGAPVVQVILPVDSIVSVLTDMEDGTQIETRTIGCEAGFGLLHSLGDPLSYETVTVQVSGEAFVIDRRELAARAHRNRSLTHNIVRHAQVDLVQSAQTVACNALHDVRKRLCRWLLMTQDRLKRPDLPLKQHHLAAMLGVQRTTVTAAAAQLQREGAISYSRGVIVINDRSQLLGAVCECYGAVERRVSWFAEEAS
jgi:CRP-like cAMP-binding protein